MTPLEIDDAGTLLKFEIEPMKAVQAEDWIYRAFEAIGEKVELEDVRMDSTFFLKALCKSSHEKKKELLNELLAQCKRVVGKNKIAVTEEDADGFIKSPLTLMKLRMASFIESFGFFMPSESRDILESLNFEKIVEKSEERLQRRTQHL